MKGKSIAYGAIFGIVIGLWEVFAGNFLHELRVPFRGEILSTFDIFILSFALFASRRREVILYIAVVAIVIKATITGTFLIGPIIGITMVSILFFLGNFIRKTGYLLGGLLAGAWAPFYFGIIKVKLLGPELLTSYKILFDKIGLSVSPQTIINISIAIGATLGAIAAYLGKSFGK